MTIAETQTKCNKDSMISNISLISALNSQGQCGLFADFNFCQSDLDSLSHCVPRS